MESQHTDPLAHGQVRENLPWFVNGRLEARLSQQITAHLADCTACRRESEELAAVLRAGEVRAMPERAVNEAKLADLLARIDAYERTQAPGGVRQAKKKPAFWLRLREQFAEWIPMHAGLVAGAVAALALVAVILPMMQSGPGNQQYVVLSSGDVQDEALRIMLQFRATPTPAAIKQLIESQYQGAYRVEQRPDSQPDGRRYVVIFAEKPGLPDISRMIRAWRKSPEIAGVQIESDALGN